MHITVAPGTVFSVVDTNVSDRLTALATAHPLLIAIFAALFGLSIVASRFLAPRWPIPPRDAKWYIRALHFLLVNWPAWGVALGEQFKSLVPGVSIPFLSFTSRPEDSLDKVRMILHEPAAAKKDDEHPKGDTGIIDAGIMTCIAMSVIIYIVVFLFAGCAPGEAYVRALQFKGEASDAVVTAHVGWVEVRQIFHDNIRRNARSLAEGEQMLEDLKKKEAKADAALIVGREAVRKFSEALKAAGAVKRRDWTGLVLEVAAAISTMVATLSEFGVHVDWSPPAVSTAPVSRAIERGFERQMARAHKCYSFVSEGGTVRFRQVGCTFFAMGGAR